MAIRPGMSRRRRRPLPETPFESAIGSLGHDGRGVGSVEGRTAFVQGALPGETVRFRLTGRQRRFDEGEVVEVLEASPDRVRPRCPHFGVCGACALQHLAPDAQLRLKQDNLMQNLERIGEVKPGRVLEPLRGPVWNYRRKARLSVRRVHAKDRVLVGFRERQGRFVADMDSCEILDARIAAVLPELGPLVDRLSIAERIPQIEVACGDDAAMLTFRHLEPLTPEDHEILAAFGERTGLIVALQPGGPDTIHTLDGSEPALAFSLPAHDLTLAFGPSDFVQVNMDLNRLMIDRALDLLDPEPGHRALDLFCGLGNFTLPLARRCAEVIGVEGDEALVRHARRNARDNGLENVAFHAADLTADPAGMPWLRESFDRVLLDPPRSGAEAILPHVAASRAARVVYVSCHPASLARDAGLLVREHGYRLTAAGVMDMFPHTGHVESIALFEREA